MLRFWVSARVVLRKASASAHHAFLIIQKVSVGANQRRDFSRVALPTPITFAHCPFGPRRRRPRVTATSVILCPLNEAAARTCDILRIQRLRIVEGSKPARYRECARRMPTT